MIDIDGLYLKDIKEKVKDLDYEYYPELIEYLAKSGKKTEVKYAETLEKKHTAYLSELKRLDMMYSFHEHVQSEFNVSNILCIDEVGRGPLAGPVTVCGVMISANPGILYVNDSKKLSEKKRMQILKEAEEKSLRHEIVSLDNNVIDELNILNATMSAMKQVVCRFPDADYVIVDGNKNIPGIDLPQAAIVGGDGKVLGIALASIIAKVTRDEFMMQMSEKYPYYGFEHNKGYGTKEHIDGLKNHGACEIHRRTFIKNFI